MTLLVNLGTIIGKFRPATPAEVAAAHPKCGTCGFHGLNSMLKIKPYNACMNPRSPYFVVADGIIDPALDYCRFHPDLNTPTETT